MLFKKLGNTSQLLPIIGQGCMGVGGYFTRDVSQDDYYVRMLQAGIEAGMTFLDTAEAYGEGHSEELVGIAIQSQRDRVILGTKVSPEHLSYSDVLRAAEGSLRRLQTRYIDLYQIHWPNPRIPLSETLDALQRLVSEGLVRYIGVSNFSLMGLQTIQGMLEQFQIQAIQNEYNLFDRTIEADLLPFCDQEHITFIAYTPLDKGVLLAKDPRRTQLQIIADKYHKTPAQVMLKWLVTHSAVVAIPKAVALSHVLENAAAVDFDLLEEDFNEISLIYDQPPVFIPTNAIQVDAHGLDKFIPGPEDLAESIRQGEPLKPIRVVPFQGDGYKYQLVEGKLRYWAWVIAHDGKKPIPALIRGFEL